MQKMFRSLLVSVCMVMLLVSVVKAGEVIYTDSWADGNLDMWTFDWGGIWELVDGKLVQKDATASKIALLDDIILEDMAVNVKVKVNSIGSEEWHGVRIALRAFGTLTRYEAMLTPIGTFIVGLTPLDDYFDLASTPDFKLEAGNVCKIRFEIEGFVLRLYVDDRLIIETEDVNERIWDGGVALMTIFSEAEFEELSIEALD